MAGGADGIPKIACPQILPHLNNRATRNPDTSLEPESWKFQFTRDFPYSQGLIVPNTQSAQEYSDLTGHNMQGK